MPQIKTSTEQAFTSLKSQFGSKMTTLDGADNIYSIYGHEIKLIDDGMVKIQGYSPCSLDAAHLILSWSPKNQ